MTAITLPTSPGPVEAQPAFLSWGADLRGPLGGDTQHISRLGSRHRVDIALPPMPPATAMAWIQRLKRGKDTGDPVRIAYPLLGFTAVGGDTLAVVTTVTGGTALAITGGTPSGIIKEGQWLSILRGGKHYLYSQDADLTLNGSGAGTLTLTPMLRTAVTAGSDTVNLTTPYIEGQVDGDELSWTLALARTVGLAFSITEKA